MGGASREKNDESYPIAHKGRRKKKKAAHTTEKILRERVNYGEPPHEIAEAEGYVRSLQNGPIGYHIMSHLTPKPEAEALVAWTPNGTTRVQIWWSKRAEWMTRPSWIGPAHELIHGWRLVTGRCVFRPETMVEEYYEEALTVGLPPYDGCRFTENKFRRGQRRAAANVLRTADENPQRGRSAKAQTYDGQVSLAAGQTKPPHNSFSGGLAYEDWSEKQINPQFSTVSWFRMRGICAEIRPKFHASNI